MKNNRLFSVSDIVFTAATVAIALLAWLFFMGAKQGGTVEFRMDGKIVESAPLNSDKTIELQGEYTNVFEIKDGEVWVSHTDCPNHQCEKMGKISQQGASIVCVPNRVSATISGEGDVDAVS
ncbi:MAG: NusG domain II-containing protein [Christensenellaceae bacterium]|jgi:hypothetical protein